MKNSKTRNIDKAVMDAFFKKHGIIKSWVCDKLHVPRNVFNSPYGLKRELAEAVEEIIKEDGEKLSKFDFSQDYKKHLDDLMRLHEDHGLMLTRIAKIIGFYETSQIRWAAQKHGGFTGEEQALILSDLRESAQAMKKFRIPKELIRKEAA